TKVVTRAGKVTLSGTVTSGEAREHAVDLAMNTEGVNSVDNQLRVQANESGMVASGKNAVDEAGDDIADTWITTKVKSTLLYSRNVSGTDIDVTTASGIVTLTGKVHDGKERALAVKLTQSVRGVKSVQANALTF
ncbi:MAG: transporter, partial [Gammaproteobacteria bacterium HGW-Gammaproteobacteria-12]